MQRLLISLYYPFNTFNLWVVDVAIKGEAMAYLALALDLVGVGGVELGPKPICWIHLVRIIVFQNVSYGLDGLVVLVLVHVEGVA